LKMGYVRTNHTRYKSILSEGASCSDNSRSVLGEFVRRCAWFGQITIDSRGICPKMCLFRTNHNRFKGNMSEGASCSDNSRSVLGEFVRRCLVFRQFPVGSRGICLKMCLVWTNHDRFKGNLSEGASCSDNSRSVLGEFVRRCLVFRQFPVGSWGICPKMPRVQTIPGRFKGNLSKGVLGFVFLDYHPQLPLVTFGIFPPSQHISRLHSKNY
jgi:hypothetical protein